MTFYVFTSAAANYLPKVRVLHDSIRRHHPEFRFRLMLADRDEGAVDFRREGFPVIALEDLDIANPHAWAFGHDIVEFSTAVKPFAALRLLEEEDCDAVLYFDPDIVLFSRLDDLLDEMREANVVLTPHLTDPEPTARGIRDNEIAALKHGVFNLGFFGVRKTEEAARFLKWWSDRLLRHCHVDFDAGLFTDQKWINHAPIFFDGVKILKSTRFNVASWNSSTRRLSRGADGSWLVNEAPLGFYHFTGFDSGAHHAMSEIYTGANPVARELIDWYTEACRRASGPNLPGWGFARYGDGTRVSDAERRRYRSDPRLQERFPDPFGPEGRPSSYRRWYRRHRLRNWLADRIPARVKRLLRNLNRKVRPGLRLHQ